MAAKTENFPLKSIPKQLFIDVARACNLRCIMCDVFSESAQATYSLANNKSPKLMEFETFCQVIDQSCEVISNFCPQGAGEPLIHPRFPEMISYIREKRPDANIWFNTNGLLLTKKLTDQLLKIGIDQIYFSIDAATPDVYEKIRIGGNYKELIQNIKYLLKARKRASCQIKPRVGVSFVLQEANRLQKKKFLKYWLPKVEQVVFYKKAELDRSRPDLFFKPKGARKPCESLWNMIAVSIDGTVVPCCGDVAREEPLGNINMKSLAKIAGAGRHLDLRCLHLEGKFSESKLCGPCKTWMASEKFSCCLNSSGLSVTRNAISECWELRK